MKFGMSRQEIKTYKETWHRWFAWYPVMLGDEAGDDAGRWVWLEVVERKPTRWMDVFTYRPSKRKQVVS